MPAMPRPNKKATKIAFDILGKPMNQNEKAPFKGKDTESRLNFEETYRK